MTTLFTDPRFLEHETGRHPESPARLAAVHRMLDDSGLRGQCATGECRAAETKALRRIHTQGYLAEFELLNQAGGGQIDADTVMGPRSLEVARLAAGSACAAVDVVCSTSETSALVLSRPPGHHALSHAAMGFCLFNNIAIAAAHARDVQGLERLLIVDWDVHHGNGTQDLFYADGRVGYLSIHRAPFYPGTGRKDETGAGPGLGTIWNRPVTFGTDRKTFRETFAAALETAADQMRPELILISAGFDAHAADPIGSLGLESEDFADLTRLVQEIARAHAGGRIVSLLEGGIIPPSSPSRSRLIWRHCWGRRDRWTCRLRLDSPKMTRPCLAGIQRRGGLRNRDSPKFAIVARGVFVVPIIHVNIAVSDHWEDWRCLLSFPTRLLGAGSRWWNCWW